jgi:phosphoribosylanthranilate isomerase
MTWIKICGTTNLEDALVAVEAGADAVGFVFYEKSPRCVSVEAARQIVQKLPEDVEKVGVFVGEPADQIQKIAKQVALTTVQLYGGTAKNRDQDWPGLQESYKVILAISGDRLSEGGIFVGAEAKKALRAILVDSGSGQQPGGTGTRFDWEESYGMVRGLSLITPVIVAGGLNPANVTAAILRFQPWGVDVASGVEAKPGKKDPEKVRAFVKAVREADKSA